MRTIFYLAFILLLGMAVACSDNDPSTDGGTDGGSTPCEPGQTRCDRKNFQDCVDGVFTTIEPCTDPLVCVQGLGCRPCNPALAVTCSDGNVVACNPDATLGGLIEDCGLAACEHGSCGGSNCSAEAQRIYVVDDSYRLLSFDPAGGVNEFTLIRALNCPAAESWPDWGNRTATPFSMSVDRSARAWVLYSSGEIFWVDTSTGACTASPHTPGQGGYELFGMGFVSDEAGSEMEKLYIAGGSVGELNSGNVARIDPANLQLQTVGPVPQAEYSPELTGTGEAKFYAYFPGLNNSFVAELSKADGSIVQQWALPSLSGTVRAWAFAHWGGKFYIFITTREGVGNNSQVLRLDPQSGQTETLLQNLPYVIVGAGVSTCAPTFEP